MNDPGAAPERTALAHIRTACCAVTLTAVTLHLRAPSPGALTALAVLTALAAGCCSARAWQLHTAKDRPMSPAAATLTVAAVTLHGGLILGLM
jgi:hypothetical protein